MTELVVGHTADLTAGRLAAARALAFEVFDDMAEDDWEHALGGVHALVVQDGQVVGHASVVQRRLLHGGHAWRTGYVEAVAVRADCRRVGHGTAMMDALERVVRSAYELGALGATDDGAGFYRARGWLPWQGPLSSFGPAGTVRTPDEDGCVFVLPVGGPVDLTGELVCDWREGDVW